MKFLRSTNLGAGSLLRGIVVTGAVAGSVLGMGTGVSLAATTHSTDTPGGGGMNVESFVGVDGTVKAGGTVGLTDGTYWFTGTKDGTAGASAVDENGQTVFEAPAYSESNTDKLAQVDFIYQITKNGAPTGDWIKGDAAAHFIAPSEYHYSTCDIYHGIPGRGGEKVTDSGYTCTMSSHGSEPWNVTFDVQ